MEFLMRGGASDKIAFNPLRYADEVDKKFGEFRVLYGLDREFTSPGFTILRPSDEELTKLIGAMKGIEVGTTKFQDMQLHGLAYVLRGLISEGILRESHWYVSFGRRAHAIYMDGKKIYFHDKLISGDPKKDAAGSATLMMVTQIGSSIYKLDGPLPAGVEPIQSPPRSDDKRPKRPRASRMRGFDDDRMDEFLVGGCLPCLEGGGQTRYDLWMAVGSDHFIRSFCYYISKDKNYSKMVGALLTGEPFADALVILEPMATWPGRAQSDHKYLIPDEIIDKWAAWDEAHGKEVSVAKFAETGFAQMMNEGTGQEFTKARLEYIAHMREDIQKASADPVSFINKSVREIMSLYKEISEKNTFNGKKVLEDDVFKALKDQYGSDLQNFLAWTMFVRLYSSAFADKDEKERLSLIAQAMPGIDPKAEITAVLSEASPAVASAMMEGLIYGGYPCYFRASLDALAAAGSSMEGNTLIIGGGFSRVDTAYRSFGRMKAKKAPAAVAKPKDAKSKAKKKKVLSALKKVKTVKNEVATLKRMKLKKKLTASDVSEAKKDTIKIRLAKLKAKKTVRKVKAEKEKMKEDEYKAKLEAAKKAVADARKAREENWDVRGKKEKKTARLSKKKKLPAKPSLADLLQ